MDATEQRFLGLVSENEPRLRRISRAYSRDRAESEDLYQEILVQLWRSLPTYRGESAPGTWVYRVALNTALGQRRRQAARPDGPLDPRHAERVGGGPRPDDGLERREQLDRLYGAIGQLPEVDRALVMMYLDDHSYREMAEVVGLSESNVGVRLHRIRKRLEAQLTETAP